MKSILLSATALTALTATAFAADLPGNRAPVAPAPAALATTWTGIYAGGHLGYGWDQYTASLAPADAKFLNPNLDADGVVGGVQLGYNHQMGNIVVGIEADGSYAGWKTNKSASASGKKTVESRVAGLASLRGRLGLAFDRTLVYATGGVGEIVSSAYYSEITKTGPKDSYKTVGVVGGGIEYKIASNMSVGLEGLVYLQPSKTSVASASGKKTFTVGTGDVGVVRAKINWNW